MSTRLSPRRTTGFAWWAVLEASVAAARPRRGVLARSGGAVDDPLPVAPAATGMPGGRHLSATPPPPDTPGGMRRVAGITATLVGTQAATSALGFLYWTIATRRFPVASIGLASTATSTMQLLGSLGMLGFGTLLIARIPVMEPTRRRVLVRSALVVVTVASAVIGLAVAVSVGILPSRGLRGIAASPADAGLFTVGVALTGIALVLDQAVLATGSGMIQLERNIVASVTKIGFLVALSFTGQHGGMAVYLSWTLGTAVSLPVVALRTRRRGPRPDPPRWLDRSALRGTWRAAAAHHSLNLALQAPLMLFPVVVTLAASTTSTGYFATDLLVAGFVFVLPFAIAIGLFASGAGDPGAVRARMRRTLPFALGASLLADAVLIPAAPLVLRVFGPAYAAHGVSALRLVVLAGLPFVVKDHYVALRRVQDRTGRAAVLVLGTSVVEVAAAAGGARVDGVVGLCVAWLAVMYAEAVLFGGVMALELRRRRPVHVRTGRLALLAPAGVGATVRAPSTRVVAVHHRRSTRGSGPAFFAMCVGLAAESAASVAGDRVVTPWIVDALFWAGLVLIFAPAGRMILSPRSTSGVRVGFTMALGLLLQVSRFALFPTQFVFHDELAHANTLRLIEASHGLFSSNPLLPVSSYYPGLELATDAVHTLFGLSDRPAAVVVLLATRAVMTLAILLGIGRITGSERLAAIAALAYVCNQQYVFFNSQYSYQTLALPLALFTVYTLLRLGPERPLRWRSMILPFAAAAATAYSHHLTSMLLVAALTAWTVLERATRGRTTLATATTRTAVFAAAVTGSWLFVPGNPVLSYLTEIGTTAYDAVHGFVQGTQSHTLFQSAGYQTPTWEILATVGSELLLVAMVATSLIRALRTRSWRRGSLAALLTVLAIGYPIVPAGHLTVATSEVTDRASGFVFLGVGFLVGTWLHDHPRWYRLRRRVFIFAGMLLAFVGQTILGSGPQWAQTPGSFLVSADSRSIDADNLAAAHWEAAHLPPGTRVVADRDASLLAGAVGGLYAVSHIADGVNASPVLLTPTWTAQDASLVRRLRIAYVIVDQRDATGLPRMGVYFESGEYDQNRTAPVPLEALTKLARVPGVTAVYDNGPVVIYDVRALDGR